MQALGLVAAHLVEVHAVAARLGLLQAQLMLAGLGLREVEAAGLEHAAGLAGLGLQLGVEVHRVVLQAGDVGAVVQAVDVGRRVPGAARGQLVALQQHAVGPAGLGQMVEDRAADHPAADHHGLRVRSHGFAPPCPAARCADGRGRSGRTATRGRL